MRSVKQVKRTHRVRSMKNAAACKRQAYRRRMQAKQNWQTNTVYTGQRQPILNAPQEAPRKLKEPKQRTAEEVAERQRVREQRRHEKELAKQKASTSALPKPKKIKKEKKPVVASVILEPKKYEKQQKQQQQQQQQQPPKEKLKTEDEKGKQQQQQQPSKESQKDSKPVTQKEKPKDDKKKKESTKLVDGGERVESKGKKQKGPSPPIISADSGTIAKETDKEKGKKRGKEELREEERQSKKDVPKEDEIKKIHNRPSENANDAIQQSHGAFAATGAETFQKIKHDDLLNEMDVVKEDVNKSLVAPAKHDDDELKHDRDSEVKADKKHHRKHKHDDLLNETDVVKEDVDKPLVTPAKHDDDELEHDRDSEMKADKKHHRKHKVSGGRHSESEKHHAPETHKQLQQPSDETVIEPVPGTDAVTHEVQPDVGNELPKKHKKKRNRKSESEHHLPSPDEVQYVEGDSVELNDAEQIEGGEFTEVISRHHKKKSRSSESDAMHDEKSNTTATEGEEQQQEEEIPNSVKPILPSSDFSGAVEERLVEVVEPAAEQQPSYDVDEQETFVKATEQIKRDDKSEEMTINELESELREQHPNEAIAAEFQHPPVQSAVEPSSDQQSSEFIPRTDDRHLIEETSKIGENLPEVFDSMLSENIKLVRTSHEEQPVAADEGHVKQDEEALPVEKEKIKEQVIDELRKNEPDESTTFTKQTEGEKNKQILPESLGGTLDFDSSNAESSDLTGVGSLSEEAPKPDETETNIFKEPPQAATDEQPPFQVEEHRMKREEKASLKGQKEDREDERGQSTTLMEENSEEVPSVQEKTSARTEGHPELLSSNVEPSDSAWMDFLSDETPMPTEPQSEAEALEDQSQTINERLPLETDESLVKHEEDALSKEPGKVENEPKPDELAAVEEETGDKKFPSEQEALERVEEMPAQGELQTSKIDSSMDSVSDEIPVSTEAQLEEKAPEDQPQTVYEEPPLETDGSPVKHEEDALSKEPGKVENEPKPDELAAVKEETGDKKTPSEQEALERVEEIPAQGELQTSMDLVSDETPVSAEAQPEEKAPENQPQTVYEEPPLETDGSPVKHEEDALSKEPGKVEKEPKPDELAAVQEETGDKKIPSEQEALERVEEIPAHGEFQTSKVKEEIDDNVKMSSEEEASGRLEVRQNRDKQKESLVESGPQEVGSVSTKEYEWPTEHESSTALPEQEMKPEMCAKDELSIEQELFEQMKHENELPKELAENVIADEEASFLEQSNNEQFGTKMSVGSVEKEFQEKENIMPPEGPDETVDRKLVESSAQHSSERIEEVIETSKQEESSKEMEQLSEAEGIGEGVVADKQNGEMKQSADKQKQNEEVNGKLTDSKVSEDFEKPSEQEQQVVSDESKSAKQSSGEIEISASMEDNNDNSKQPTLPSAPTLSVETSEEMVVEEVIPPPIILASCPCDGPHKNGQHTHAPTTHKTTEVITVGDVPTEEKVVVDKNVITLDSAVSPEQFAANVAKLAEEHPELMKSANLEQLGEGVTGKLTVTTYTTTTTVPQEAVKVAKRDPVVLPVEREQRAEMLRQKRERVYKLLPRDIEFCTRMIETYGDDYEAMVNDAANIYRDTAKSIQRKIRVFRKSPQFEVYLKSKNNSPQTSPIPSS